MEQYIYERPREKIRTHGVNSLSPAELLQVIIGSGTKQRPVAQLANEVCSLIANRGRSITYEELCTIRGIGGATACKVLAALSLNKNFIYAQKFGFFSPPSIKLATRKTQTLLASTFDAQRNKIAEYSWPTQNKLLVNTVFKQLQSTIINDKATNVLIELGWRNQMLILGVVERKLVASLNDCISSLEIQFASLRLVNQLGSKIVWSTNGDR